MNILLISSNICVEPFPVYPIGMSVIAAVLTKEGHRVTQFDILPDGMDGLEKRLKEESFDLIGLSIRNIDTVNSRKITHEIIRTPLRVIELCRKLSSAPIMLGGPGFSLLPEEIMQVSGADYGVVGEGEKAVAELVSEIHSGRTDIPKLRVGEPLNQVVPLYSDELMAYYYKNVHMIPIQTKRGCPFKCVYCTYPLLEGHRIRQRDVDPVLDQMTELAAKMPDAMFFFVDSVFNDPGGQYLKLLNRMKERGLRFPYAAFISPGNLSDAEIDLMTECGLISTELGLDGASDIALRGLRKNFTFEEARHVTKALMERKVGVNTNLMFCGPGETYDTIREGIDNILSLIPAYSAVFSGIRILPGTPLYTIAKEKNLVPDNWNGIDELFYFEPGLDPETVNTLLEKGFNGNEYCVYPPDRFNRALRTIHRIGYVKYREFMGKD